MRILDDETSRPLTRVTIYLTTVEANELRSTLKGLLADPVGLHHAHVPGDDYRKEVTVTIYDTSNPDLMNQFDQRSRKLILEDK